ncbi:hypothetical protein DFH08DRAFT_903388 [Mycena albidolilacea]|uniref:Uncharacterized protein n=1 Tax=Mycena albidolilacea TaxID=1033008 RepID=A0AAD7E959_9AGAR|nr:hypothetical protein DFH08DRAFT_903388 [Mycena albidolilacea]
MFSGCKDGWIQLLLKSFMPAALATIVVAAEVGALWLLITVAYYDICRAALEVRIEHPLWMTLGEKERRACLVRYQAQIRHPRIASFLFISKNKYHDCRDWTECTRFRPSMGETINPTLLDSSYMSSPLDLLTELGTM